MQWSSSKVWDLLGRAPPLNVVCSAILFAGFLNVFCHLPCSTVKPTIIFRFSESLGDTFVGFFQPIEKGKLVILHTSIKATIAFEALVSCMLQVLD
ncbi:hypothetical protein Syun_015240 [Stephania yunnanensis]|uniref:Uncharacterized protein n=1 Tax=Stephania yunnanensis TaxID=152371 RepID=A0AAP0PCQ1_9MAGN